ncbi:MAG: serine O-acetyltransferase [Terriglobia bacterium]
MNPVRFYRLSRWFYLHGIPLLPKLVERLCILICHCYLPPAAEIGEGFQVGYWGFGIVIHPQSKIGKNVFVGQGVTIGGRSQKLGVPRIGDNVFIAAGAKVLGDIDIGEGSVIGANAVVIKPVAARSVVAGVPARVIRENVDVRELTGWPPPGVQ